MEVLFICNDGGGFAAKTTVPEGTNVATFIAEKMPHAAPQDFLIRVNRAETTADQILKDGDRLSVTPVKIEGA